MYMLFYYEYFDAYSFVLVTYACVSCRQNLHIFIQFVLIFVVLYFSNFLLCSIQICQVYLLTHLKKRCYISSIWLAFNETRMSIKGKGVDVNDMEIPNEDLSLRINMANLSLRDDFQSGDHVSRHHPDPMRGQTNELTDDHFQEENSKAHHINDTDTGKRKRTLTEKGKQYRASILYKKKKSLVSRVNRKMSDVDVLLYTHENDTTVKEELQQLNDVFKLIEEINQEMIELDDNYTEDMWFSEIDDKVFAFKHRIHNWLKEGEKFVKFERKSKSSEKRAKSSGSKSSKSNSTSSFRLSKLSAKEKAIQEKVRVAELQAETSFVNKKRDAEWQAESLRLEEEMAKARARVKIYENENQDQEMTLKIEAHKQGNITYHQQTTKLNEVNQHSDPTNVRIHNVYDSIPRENYDQKFEKTNIQHAFKQTPRINPVEVAITKSERAVEDCEMGKMLYQLVKEQLAPAVDIEEFDGNPLHYNYFRSMFCEVVEKKIADPQGRLTRLIKLTTGEVRELIKPFIHDNPEYGYENAMKLLERQYGNPFKLLACYRNEIKWMTKIKPGDAAAYRRLFNLLIKCQSLQYSNNQNPLDIPDVICMILSKVPGFLQDRWDKHVHKIRKTSTREPGLPDLTNFIEDEMNIVNDPLFSREAVWQYEDKPLKPHRRKKIQNYAIKETSGNENKGTSKCPICEGQHDIEECTTILEQAVEDRSKTIYKKRLCYGCLEEISKEHNAESCSNRRQCKVCNGRHPTILHGIKIE